ncbi:DHS-like NAD/FAD-binding domain containing protein [Rhypophila decipiens]
MFAFRLSHERDHLSALKDKIKTKRNIVVITGAGISTNTGIPDYQSSARSKKSSRNVYDASAYSTTESAKELNDDVLHKLRCGLTAPFTPFDAFLERLARSNRLRRHYTQNIDCRHTRSQFLTRRTTWLHGRADTLMCHLRLSHTMQVTPRVFQRSVMKICPVCKKEQTERAKAGKRMRAVGILRPKVLLYGESCPDETEITAALNSDLEEPIDAVLIVGTRLSIPSVFNFTKRLCEVVAGRPEGLVVWVSKEPPRIDDTFRAYIGVEYIGDCDDFARMISG